MLPRRWGELQSWLISDFAREGLRWSFGTQTFDFRARARQREHLALVMWLLNTGTLKLERFYGKVPKYAILSHRWMKKQEVTFRDFVESYEQLGGHRKIKSFCRKARDEHYDYV